MGFQLLWEEPELLKELKKVPGARSTLSAEQGKPDPLRMLGDVLLDLSEFPALPSGKANAGGAGGCAGHRMPTSHTRLSGFVSQVHFWFSFLLRLVAMSVVGQCPLSTRRAQLLALA